MEFSNAQWGTQFANTVTGAVFSSLGTGSTPIQVLEDALSAYNKAETAFNNAQTAPPYLNSVTGPITGTIIFGANGEPIQPINYQVNTLKAFSGTKITPKTSPTII
jgi:hypothetical protein